MRTPLILLSLLILSLLPGYGMRERTMSSQTGNDTVVFFDRYGTTEPRKINGEIHGNITSLRDPNTPTDSIRMDNYQWAISTKHLTYPEYRRMIYPLKAAIDAAYEPGYDTIYIQPADSKLKVHHAELTVDYSNETKPTPLLKDLRCAGSMSGILGNCKIGEAVAFQLSYSIDYVQLKEKNNIFSPDRRSPLKTMIPPWSTSISNCKSPASARPILCLQTGTSSIAPSTCKASSASHAKRKKAKLPIRSLTATITTSIKTCTEAASCVAMQTKASLRGRFGGASPSDIHTRSGSEDTSSHRNTPA